MDKIRQSLGHLLLFLSVAIPLHLFLLPDFFVFPLSVIFYEVVLPFFVFFFLFLCVYQRKTNGEFRCRIGAITGAAIGAFITFVVPNGFLLYSSMFYNMSRVKIGFALLLLATPIYLPVSMAIGWILGDILTKESRKIRFESVWRKNASENFRLTLLSAILAIFSAMLLGMFHLGGAGRFSVLWCLLPGAVALLSIAGLLQRRKWGLWVTLSVLSCVLIISFGLLVYHFLTDSSLLYEPVVQLLGRHYITTEVVWSIVISVILAVVGLVLLSGITRDFLQVPTPGSGKTGRGIFTGALYLVAILGLLGWSWAWLRVLGDFGHALGLPRVADEVSYLAQIFGYQTPLPRLLAIFLSLTSVLVLISESLVHRKNRFLQTFPLYFALCLLLMLLLTLFLWIPGSKYISLSSAMFHKGDPFKLAFSGDCCILVGK